MYVLRRHKDIDIRIVIIYITSAEVMYTYTIVFFFDITIGIDVIVNALLRLLYAALEQLNFYRHTPNVSFRSRLF